MVIKNISRFQVRSNQNLREAIKIMDAGGIGFVYITDLDDKIIAVLTDGDFRRAILNGNSLEDSILLIANKQFRYLKEEYVQEEVDQIFNGFNIFHLPVIENGKVIKILTKSAFDSNDLNNSSLNGIPVVIMAGGKGTRMKPFTHIFPKPLIPMGEKSMLEVIMDEYKRYGIDDFFLSVNFKKNLIKTYFEDKEDVYSIKYLEEDEPLGTAGALKMLQGGIKSTFFVSNCDIIIKGEYDKMLKFHDDGGYDLTLIGSMQHMKVPYGVCTIQNGGDLNELIEKPSYDFLVNTGMYILNPNVIDLIPNNTFYHITHLMEDLKKQGKKVGVYPVSEKSWIDVGQWEEYNSALSLLK